MSTPTAPFSPIATMYIRLTVFLTLIILGQAAQAGCSPQTVEFYLEKGFNQTQITRLCSTASDTPPAYQPYQKPVVIYQQGQMSGHTAEQSRAITELRGSIDGRSVEVTDTHINYIRRVCIRAGKSPERDQRVRKCIDVAFSIARDGLRVAQSGATFLLFGQQIVEVSSNNIVRKHVTADPWQKFSPDIRYLLQRKYQSREKGNATTIPLRKSASTGQVVNALRTIAAATEFNKTGSHESEVAKVLNDAYVPPTEEEYLAANPLPRKVEKEKKKKWWNPFD